MTYDDLRTLLDYHYWARDRLLAAVEALTPEQFTRDLGNSFRSVRDTVAHIVGAETAWLSRWQGHSPIALLSTDQFPDMAAVRKVWSSLENQVRAFLDNLGEHGVSKVFEYKMLSGAPGSSPYWQMQQHVVNHASYHRGQVVTMLRQLGAQPPKSMDMIAFYRERAT
jgi:uncharacterized damage-inducible protein DinB